tara:strand:- start:296 stop:586 length:291 start_codon:yes stop_codon:yes gene_type:complete
MTLPTNMVTNVLSESQNKFITVKFLTKDNEVRKYNGRMNVIKGLKGNERGSIASEALRRQGYITLKTKQGYKCFNVDRVLGFVAGGRRIFGLGTEV